jgi:Trehalose utilisation
MKSILTLLALLTLACTVTAGDWVTYEGKAGPGKGKHIVFLSGDEEYRSEEGMPMLAKILSQHHGFKCTVLFAVDPATGEINPGHVKNIPGTETLSSADLMVISTRFRNLPDEQMKPIDDFLKAGKPVIGLRTATHAFNGIKGTYAHYNNGYSGEKTEWKDGFGRLVLGEQWISHHGGHKTEATRGIFAPDAKDNALLNGIKDGEIWGATDVYGVRLPLPGDSKPIVLGQVLKRKGPQDISDRNFGLKPDDEPVVDKPDAKNKKNDPMMPVAWTKSYQVPGGKPGKSFTTTMGSSTDLENEALRRLLVNATYQLSGLKIPAKADVSIVGDYAPLTYGFGGHKKGVKPADLEMK